MTVHDLHKGEHELLAIYEQLRDCLAEHGEALAPYQERNALKALACLWQIANGLDADPEQLYEFGA